MNKRQMYLEIFDPSDADSDSDSDSDSNSNSNSNSGSDSDLDSDSDASTIIIEPTQNEFVNLFGIVSSSSSSSSDSSDDESPIDYDIDRVIEKQHKERSAVRGRRKAYTNPDLDKIKCLIGEMMEAAKADTVCIKKKQTPTKKIAMMAEVKKGLDVFPREALLNEGMMEAITAWLQVLPGGRLPAFSIRSLLCAKLNEVTNLELLIESGIGKVLKVHRRLEKDKNQIKLLDKIIATIFRQIFTPEVHEFDKEKRRKVEKQLVRENKIKLAPKKPKTATDTATTSQPTDLKFLFADDSPPMVNKQAKRGDARARIPDLETNVYINRPEDTLDAARAERDAKKTNRLKSYQLRLGQIKRNKEAPFKPDAARKLLQAK